MNKEGYYWRPDSEISCDESHYPGDADILNICIYPEPVLKKVAVAVEDFNGELQSLAQNMLRSMYHAPGIGLAAPQVGQSVRIFVLDTDYQREEQSEESADQKKFHLTNLNPQIFINPVITKKSTDLSTYEEGCLSLPGMYAEVKRPAYIELDYYNITGDKQSLAADGLLATCIQHEIDHLDGVLFFEKLSRLKHSFLKKKFLKSQKS